MEVGPLSDNVKHLLAISEMLDILVEGNEKLNKQCKSLESLKESSASNIFSIFHIATQQISNILQELPEKVTFCVSISLSLIQSLFSPIILYHLFFGSIFFFCFSIRFLFVF